MRQRVALSHADSLIKKCLLVSMPKYKVHWPALFKKGKL